MFNQAGKGQIEEAMKVCLVSGIFPPDIGGPASYVAWLAEELLFAGHQVQVVCLADAPEKTQTCPYPVSRLCRGKSLPVRILSSAARIAAVARDADLLYVNGLGLEAKLSGYALPKPMVFKVVSDWAWERACNRKLWRGGVQEFQQSARGIRFWLLKALRNYFLGAAMRIIVPSAYLSKLVQSWGIPKETIHIIPNSVKFPDKLKGLQTDLPRPTLVTAGRLIKLKGIAALLEALADIPGPGLLVVGDGPERFKLESYAAKLKLEGRVHFTGAIERDKFLGYLKGADALVLNSIHEGLPHVIIEALSLGKPVLATRVGGVPELIEDNQNGLLVEPDDKSSLANAIKRLVSDAALRQRLAAKASIRKEEFSAKKIFGQTLKIFEEVLSV